MSVPGGRGGRHVRLMVADVDPDTGYTRGPGFTDDPPDLTSMTSSLGPDETVPIVHTCGDDRSPAVTGGGDRFACTRHEEHGR